MMMRGGWTGRKERFIVTDTAALFPRFIANIIIRL